MAMTLCIFNTVVFILVLEYNPCTCIVKIVYGGWGRGLQVDHLSSMHQVLGSVFSPEKPANGFTITQQTASAGRRLSYPVFTAAITSRNQFVGSMGWLSGQSTCHSSLKNLSLIPRAWKEGTKSTKLSSGLHICPVTRMHLCTHIEHKYSNK